MSDAPHSAAGRAGRWLRRLLFLCVAGLLLAYLYITTAGFPDWASKELLGWLSRQSSYAMMAGSLRLTPTGAIAARHARIYRKGVLGPPAAEAAQVVVQLDLRAPREHRAWICRIAARNAIVRPEQAFRTNATDTAREIRYAVRSALDFTDCVVNGIRVTRMTGQLNGAGPVLRFDQIDAQATRGDMTGELRGSFAYDSANDEVTGSLDARVDPHLLLPVLEVWRLNAAIELVHRFQFRGERPRFHANFRQRCTRVDPLIAEADFWLTQCEYMKVPALRVDGTAHLRVGHGENDVEVRPLLVVREEGTVRAVFRVRPDAGLLTFEGESNADPRALAKALGLFSDRFLSAWHVAGQVQMSGKGVADYRQIDGTDIRGRVAGRGIGLWGVISDECSFDVTVKGRTNVVSDIRGRIYGGDFTGRASFVMAPDSTTNITYQVQASLRDAEFAELAQALFKEGHENYRGQLRGSATVSGPFDAHPERSMRGEGKVRVANGRVFMMPLFGGFTDYMARMIPGMDLVLRQTDAVADFRIGDGKVTSERLAIEGGVLSLSGRGDYRFDNTLDYNIQVKLLRDNLVGKLIRLPTWIFSKLFEFRLRGTLDAPEWYLLNFSPELFERLGLRRSAPDERNGAGTNAASEASGGNGSSTNAPQDRAP